MKMYFIAHVLPEDLNTSILKYKEMMHERFQCKVALKSPAHITFIPPYYMDPLYEQQLIDDLDLFCYGRSEFEISTQNFSSFKPRTIFIDVYNNADLQTLKIACDQFFDQSRGYLIQLDKRSFHPHITIATRDILKRDYYFIYPWFDEQEFRVSWEFGSLSLLRHNSKKWDVIHTSHFNS